jgi:serine/threonine-protein kinase
VDRAGQETPVLDRFGAFADPRLSPDGRLLGVTLSEGSRDIWIYEFARGVFTRLTRHGASAFNPVWTPDGRRVIYSGETPQFDLFWRAADGSTPVETLLTTPNDKVARSVTPDGKYLLYNENAPTSDIWMLALDGSRERRRLTDTPYDEVGPAVSPDGRWLAYVSDESGKGELYVMPFPEGGRRIQVSIDGGGLAVWARSGREILYRDGDRMLSARFDPRSGQVERPVEIFVRPYAHTFASANFDIWPDGQRLLMVRTPPELLPREVEVVVNWFDELKRRMAEAQ